MAVLTVYLDGIGQVPADWLQIPFSLTCTNCDAGSAIGSIRQAKLIGWRGILRDDGLSWNFLGYCPECGPACCGHEWDRTPFVYGMEE